MNEVIARIDRHQIELFCKQRRIRRLAFFGSAVRGDFGPQSDIDTKTCLGSK
jgi:predicted nucleotidyltransferase